MKDRDSLTTRRFPRAPEELGLTLSEGKQLTAVVQAEIVRAQVAAMGER
jgi:hypothetical protein